jgi:hypothetical protein
MVSGSASGLELVIIIVEIQTVRGNHGVIQLTEGKGGNIVMSLNATQKMQKLQHYTRQMDTVNM